MRGHVNRVLIAGLLAFATASPALAEDYVSPHSWFGYPGTMLNDEKTFTAWFPKKPVPEDESIEINGTKFPQKSFLLLVGAIVFYVHDYDFSGMEKPYETFVGYLKAHDFVFDSEMDENIGDQSGHHILYHRADGTAPVEMRTFQLGSHLYTAAVVANDKLNATVKTYADHFLSSFRPYKGAADAK